MSYCGCSSKRKEESLDDSIQSLFTGGRVVMPSEYFGKSSGRYLPEGSSGLKPENSAYGANIPTSHGVAIGKTAEGILSGPELGPSPNATSLQTGGHTGGQTCGQAGGKSSRKRKSSKRSSKKKRRSSHKKRKSIRRRK
jgi:hypothetical protein